MQTCDHLQQTEKVGRVLSLPAILVRSCSLHILSLPQNKIILKSLCFATVSETHHTNMRMEVVEKETQGHNEKNKPSRSSRRGNLQGIVAK